MLKTDTVLSRIFIAIAAALGCAGVICAILATTAGASPLLSGYGGPGTGEQQIIGSALVGGHKGGGGGSGAGGGGYSGEAGGSASGGGVSVGQPQVGEGTAQEGPASGRSAGAAGAGHSASGGPEGDQAAGRQSGGERSGGGSARVGQGEGGRSPAGVAESRGAANLPPAVEEAASQSPTLGLSSGQALAVLLVAVGLVLAALSSLGLAALRKRREAADRSGGGSGR